MDFNGAGTGTVPRPQYPKDYFISVPNILRGVRKVTTYQTEAVNSVNMTAGRIIHLIDKDIRIQKSAGINEHSAKYIENLEATKELMKQYPEDEKFRMRVHGFSETMLRVHYISSSPNYNDGKSVSYHGHCVACLSAMKLSVMELSSTVNSKKQNLAFMTP